MTGGSSSRKADWASAQHERVFGEFVSESIGSGGGALQLTILVSRPSPSNHWLLSVCILDSTD